MAGSEAWTGQEIVTAIRAWAERTGHPPGAEDWRGVTSDAHPPTRRVIPGVRVVNLFYEWALRLHRPLVPGAHVLIAATPLLSHSVAVAIEAAGFERRGEVIRVMNSIRGGDRPKGGHTEYPEVSVIPKAAHEPWLLFRKPLDRRIRDNLERWGTGGLRRPSRGRGVGLWADPAPADLDLKCALLDTATAEDLHLAEALINAARERRRREWATLERLLTLVGGEAGDPGIAR